MADTLLPNTMKKIVHYSYIILHRCWPLCMYIVTIFCHFTGLCLPWNLSSPILIVDITDPIMTKSSSSHVKIHSEVSIVLLTKQTTMPWYLSSPVL